MREEPCGSDLTPESPSITSLFSWTLMESDFSAFHCLLAFFPSFTVSHKEHYILCRTAVLVPFLLFYCFAIFGGFASKTQLCWIFLLLMLKCSSTWVPVKDTLKSWQVLFSPEGCAVREMALSRQRPLQKVQVCRQVTLALLVFCLAFNVFSTLLYLPSGG